MRPEWVPVATGARDADEADALPKEQPYVHRGATDDIRAIRHDGLDQRNRFGANAVMLGRPRQLQARGADEPIDGVWPSLENDLIAFPNDLAPGRSA